MTARERMILAIQDKMKGKTHFISDSVRMTLLTLVMSLEERGVGVEEFIDWFINNRISIEYMNGIPTTDSWDSQTGEPKFLQVINRMYERVQNEQQNYELYISGIEEEKKCNALYVIYDKNKIPVYVGSTTWGNMRFVQSVEERFFFEPYLIKYLYFEDQVYDFVKKLEYLLINHLNPLANKTRRSVNTQEENLAVNNILTRLDEEPYCNVLRVPVMNVNGFKWGPKVEYHIDNPTLP